MSMVGKKIEVIPAGISTEAMARQWEQAEKGKNNGVGMGNEGKGETYRQT